MACADTSQDAAHFNLAHTVHVSTRILAPTSPQVSFWKHPMPRMPLVHVHLEFQDPNLVDVEGL